MSHASLPFFIVLFYCMDSMRSVDDGCAMVMIMSVLVMSWLCFCLRFENDNLYLKKKSTHLHTCS